MKAISAIIFMIGSLSILLGMIITVIIVVVQTAILYGPGLAGLLLICIAFLAYSFSEVISIPFRSWLLIWDHLDNQLNK